MSANIIDRRLNPSGKSLINRKKFLRRAKEQIKKTVKEAVSAPGKSLRDIGSGENVKIKQKDMSEPTFRHDPNSGSSKRVLPGNKEYSVGDTINKPKGGGKGGSGDPSEGDPDAENNTDDFQFTLTREEFLHYLFEDLELPDFIKENIEGSNAFENAREGFTNYSSPANLNIEQTYKKSIGRRLALGRPSDDEISQLRDEIEQEERKGKNPIELYEKLDELLSKQKTIPFIDEKDLKYNNWTKKPKPINKAVMFCLMDVSGSMGEKEKDISKRFFLLLYLFLEKRYEAVDIRFIRHTTTAEEVDEQTFFYDPLSGGTIISSGLTLINDIIKKEYPTEEWNIYIAQCTDGDNTTNDNKEVERIIESDLLPVIQYYAYIQVRGYSDEGSTMWYSYSAWPVFKKLDDAHQKLVARQVDDINKIWTVFHELFSKKQN